MTDTNIIAFVSDAVPDRVLFCENQSSGMIFHCVADAENCPIAYGYSVAAGEC
jgi:hypothetical protein